MTVCPSVGGNALIFFSLSFVLLFYCGILLCCCVVVLRFVVISAPALPLLCVAASYPFFTAWAPTRLSVALVSYSHRLLRLTLHLSFSMAAWMAGLTPLLELFCLFVWFDMKPIKNGQTQINATFWFQCVYALLIPVFVELDNSFTTTTRYHHIPCSLFYPIHLWTIAKDSLLVWHCCLIGNSSARKTWTENRKIFLAFVWDEPVSFKFTKEPQISTGKEYIQTTINTYQNGKSSRIRLKPIGHRCDEQSCSL